MLAVTIADLSFSSTFDDVPTVPLAVLEHNKTYFPEKCTVLSGSEVRDMALVTESYHVKASRS